MKVSYKIWRNLKFKQRRLFKDVVQKKDILKNVVDKFGGAISSTGVNDIADIFIDVIIDELAAQRSVEIKNFGTFSIVFNYYKCKSAKLRAEDFKNKNENDKVYNKILFYPSQTMLDLLKIMKRRNDLNDSVGLGDLEKKVKS